MGSTPSDQRPRRDDAALLAWLGEPAAGAEFAVLQAVARGQRAGPEDSSAPQAPGSAPTIDEFDGWGPERTVRAEFIRRLLLDADSPADARGVWLRNLRIAGQLDLEGCECPRSLVLEHCHLSAGEPVNLDFATVPTLLITRCLLPGLTGSCLEVKKSADFSRTRFTARVSLPNASVADNLDFSGAQVDAPGPGGGGHGPVDLDAIAVGGRLRLDTGFSALRVNLRGAQLSANLNCRMAVLTGREVVLSVEQATVKGEALLDGLSATGGQLRFRDATILGSLGCDGVQLGVSDGVSLDGEAAKVGGAVRLRRGFTAAGTVRFPRAILAGNLNCRNSHLNGPDYSLVLWRAKIGGDLLMDPATTPAENGPCRCVGGIRLDGASIGGNLRTGGARTGTSLNGRSLSGEALTVGGSVTLGRFSGAGTVWLRGANVGAELSARGCTLTAAAVAINAERISVGGDVLIGTDGTTAGLQADGAVRLPGARIVGGFDCDGARMQALTADRSTVGGDLRLCGALTIAGAISLRRAQVSGTLRWNPSTPATGIVDLGGCAAHRLRDNWSGGRAEHNGYWPQPGLLRLDGFTYVTIDGGPGDGAERRLGWIRSQYPAAPFSSQPYEELTNCYQSAGQDSDARTMAVNRRRDRRRYGELRRFRRITSWLLDVSIAYGYATWRALLYLAAVYAVVLGFSIYAGEHPGTMVPSGSTAGLTPTPTTTRCTSDYPCYSPVGYAIDTVVPLVNIHQASNWQPNADAPSGWIFVVVGWAGTVLGYALATLAVAGYTGLVRGGDGF